MKNHHIIAGTLAIVAGFIVIYNPAWLASIAGIYLVVNGILAWQTWVVEKLSRETPLLLPPLPA